MNSVILPQLLLIILLIGNLGINLLAFATKTDAQVIPDHTLPQNTGVTQTDKISEIQSGTRVGDNLFHSFEAFSIPDSSEAFFKLEPVNLTVQTIISRVTGDQPSQINGTIRINNGANLFLINPHGIVFGAKAKLDMGGSFLASTANSIQFPDGREFSATNSSTPPLLSINVPIGLQFGSNPAAIENQSIGGLQVDSRQTLALVGGELRFPGGHLLASQGRIELGSVGENSFVQITPMINGFILGYQGVNNFQDIHLSQQSFSSTFDAGRGGDVLIQASDSIELMGTTPDGRFKSAIASNAFQDATQATGNVTIETRRLTIRDGAGIGAATFGMAQGGTVNVQASDRVELIGTSANGRELSSLNTQSFGKGAAGDIEVYARELVLRDGGVISTTTQDAGRAGRLVVRASESVELSGVSADGKFPSSLRSDASSDSVPSGFIPPPRTEVLGEAGDVTIETGRLMIQDGAEITVNGEKLSAAGNLRVNADLIWLNNGSTISATTLAGTEGNITLQTQNLLLQNQSKISTNAENANGGNITIDTDTLVALKNSDISANAQAGTGGRVTINTSGIFGTQFREALTPESDITATSALGPNFKGTVNINIQGIDPNQGLIQLPENFIESRNQIVTACHSDQSNSFVVTGRGGLPEDPVQTLRGRTLWQDLRTLALNEQEENHVETLQTIPGSGEAREVGKKSPYRHSSIVEAQGWIINAQGQVELVAHVPEVIPQNSWYQSTNCFSQ